MKINIEELEKLTLLLLSRLRESSGVIIELNNDFYWDIPTDELYNPYEEPKNITLGQLSDDFNEVIRLSKSNDVIPYGVKRLSSIFRAISSETLSL